MAAALTLALGTGPGEGRARAAGDTTYGRIEGDLELAPGIGATASSYGVRPSIELRARYLSMAGLFVTYEESFGQRTSPARLVATGVELRPLFVARWFQGLESGRPTLDLLVDSFGLELGAFFAQPASGAFGARMGLQAGLGLELPLFGEGEGLFLTAHGGGRFSDGALYAAPIAPPSGGVEPERAAYFTLGLSWHEIVQAGILR